MDIQQMKQNNFEQAHKNSLKFQEQIIVTKHNMEALMNDLTEQFVTVADCEILAAMIAERPDEELSSIARMRKQHPELSIVKKFNLVDFIEETATPENEITLEFTTKEVVENAVEVAEQAKQHAQKTAMDKAEKKPAKPRVRREPICLQRHKIDGACDILIEVVRPTRQEEKKYLQKVEQERNF